MMVEAVETLSGPSHCAILQAHLCCNLRCPWQERYPLDFHPTCLMELVVVITFWQNIALTCKYKPTDEWVERSQKRKKIMFEATRTPPIPSPNSEIQANMVVMEPFKKGVRLEVYQLYNIINWNLRFACSISVKLT